MWTTHQAFAWQSDWDFCTSETVSTMAPRIAFTSRYLANDRYLACGMVRVPLEAWPRSMVSTAHRVLRHGDAPCEHPLAAGRAAQRAGCAAAHQDPGSTPAPRTHTPDPTTDTSVRGRSGTTRRALRQE